MENPEEIIERLRDEIDRLKLDLQFSKNEAIAIIRLKNEQIERLKGGNKNSKS